MAIVVLAFGIQSLLDFTFYFPGIAIPALLCAGWLAGRGPLTAPVGRRPEGRVSIVQRPAAGVVITGLAAVVLIGGWLMWQPLRSAQAMADAENHPETAFASARAAASRDPLSIDPLYLLSELYQGPTTTPSARAELVKATQVQPDNPQSWLWLGQLDAGPGHPEAAIAELQHALSLDLPVTTDTDYAAGAHRRMRRPQLARRKRRCRSSARQRGAGLEQGLGQSHPGARPRRHR